MLPDVLNSVRLSLDELDGRLQERITELVRDTGSRIVADADLERRWDVTCSSSASTAPWSAGSPASLSTRWPSRWADVGSVKVPPLQADQAGPHQHNPPGTPVRSCSLFGLSCWFRGSVHAA